MNDNHILSQATHDRIGSLMQMAHDAMEASRMDDAARYLRIAAHLANLQSIIRPARGANDE